MYRIGLIYYFGTDGIQQDKQQAYQWFKKAMIGGHIDATYKVATLCMNGYGNDKDLRIVEILLLEWTNAGNKEAEQALRLLQKTEKERQKKTFIEELEKRAENNDVSAIVQLGAIYYEGAMGLAKDRNKAFEWSKKAVTCGYLDAVVSMTFLCEEGYGDIEETLEFIKKWEYTGNKKIRKAIRALMRLLTEKENEKKQQEEEKRRNDRISALRMFEMGIDFFHKKDYETAARWYKRAAEKGLASAQDSLGWCYSRGYGVDKSWQEAIKWYRKAAEQGMATSQNCLGMIYRDGEVVQQDYIEAFQWFQKAAAQGYEDANRVLENMKSESEHKKSWISKLFG